MSKKKKKTKSEDKKQSAKDKFEDVNNKYLRLFAEFENFKKRTSKERIELYKTAGEGILSSLLPILDDFERAIKAKKDSIETEEGFLLIYNKMKSTLEQKGLKVMNSCIGQELDTDFHEAISKIPAPSEDMKGKIIEEVEKGYFLNDKVIRYAKVIVANN